MEARPSAVPRRTTTATTAIKRRISFSLFSGMMILALFLLILPLCESRNVTNVTVKRMELKPAARFYVLLETSFDGEGFVDASGLEFRLPTDESSKSASRQYSAGKFKGQEPSTYLDVALLKQGEDCFTNRGSSCDWNSLGLGAVDDQGDRWFCCDKEAIQAFATGDGSEDGDLNSTSTSAPDVLCDAGRLGRLILNSNFVGSNMQVIVPPRDESSWDNSINYLDGEDLFFDADAPGTYAMIITNCNEESGRLVTVSGTTAWISYEHVIQEFVKENVPFYSIMMVLYSLLWVWFYRLMRENADTRIKLESWILTLIILGWVDVALRLTEYWIIDDKETISRALASSAAIVNGVKHGISRSVLLMLSMGLGIVHPNLDPTVISLIFAITFAYIGLKATVDILIEYEDDSDLTTTLNVIAACFWVAFCIDVIFMVWIPSALVQTMKLLQEGQQRNKLDRYRSLMRIILLAIFLTFLALVLIGLDFLWNGGEDVTILNLSQGNEINFFVVLVAVAYLWRPNPFARDYAYAMEVSMDDSGRDGVIMDLELTETTDGKASGTDYSAFPVERGHHV